MGDPTTAANGEPAGWISRFEEVREMASGGFTVDEIHAKTRLSKPTIRHAIGKMRIVTRWTSDGRGEECA